MYIDASCIPDVSRMETGGLKQERRLTSSPSRIVAVLLILVSVQLTVLLRFPDDGASLEGSWPLG